MLEKLIEILSPEYQEKVKTVDTNKLWSEITKRAQKQAVDNCAMVDSNIVVKWAMELLDAGLESDKTEDPKPAVKPASKEAKQVKKPKPPKKKQVKKFKDENQIGFDFGFDLEELETNEELKPIWE